MLFWQERDEGATVVEGRRAAGRGSRGPVRPPASRRGARYHAHVTPPLHFARGELQHITLHFCNQTDGSNEKR